jgi:outer membrane protein OmpU
MKKILVASTALVAAGMITAGSASASEKIKLNLGGYSKWWVVGAWQDDSFEASQGANGQGDANSVDVKGDNEIWFSGSTKLDNGLEVGINIELEAGGNTDTAGGQNTTGDVIDKSYVYISGGFGKVIVGTESNGTVLLHTMAPEAAGNSGADGILTGGLAIAQPTNVGTKVTTEIDTDAEADKITYVAPTFYGLTVGATYVPNAGEDNQRVYGGAAASGAAGVQANEIYGVGAMYAGKVFDVGVKASAGWVTYDIAQATSRSNEYAFGTQLSYAGFTLGGSYRMVRENASGGVNSVANGNSASGDTWDIGLTYETGPWTVGAFYLNSQANGDMTVRGDDEFTVYQISGKYNMGAGVDLLATIGHAEYDDESAKASNADANHNEGWAVMTGLSLQF